MLNFYIQWNKIIYIETCLKIINLNIDLEKELQKKWLKYCYVFIFCIFLIVWIYTLYKILINFYN